MEVELFSSSDILMGVKCVESKLHVVSLILRVSFFTRIFNFPGNGKFLKKFPRSRKSGNFVCSSAKSR